MKILDFDWKEMKEEIPPRTSYHQGDEEKEFLLEKLKKVKSGTIFSKNFETNEKANNRVQTWKNWFIKRGIKIETTSRKNTLYIKKI